MNTGESVNQKDSKGEQWGQSEGREDELDSCIFYGGACPDVGDREARSEEITGSLLPSALLRYF